MASYLADDSVEPSNVQATQLPAGGHGYERPGHLPEASAALPPNIDPPTCPLAQVIKLVQAGVDENIITTYINNSTSTFNLDADKIIYLDNVGVPKNLVNAMMQRDQVLQAQMAAASTPSPQPTPAPETVTTEVAPEPDVVSVDYFQTTLQPYGTWVDVEGYGRCWRPTVVVYNSGWQPYCDRGHWVYSDCGWYWVSDYSWGATFHYGRWFRHARFGWVWWPDTVWAPSWVTWRYADDYCGWAPLPPFTGWQAGVGFVYRGSGISVGFDFGLAADAFIFVPAGHFCDPQPRRFRAAPTEVTRIYNRTTVINNYNYDSHNRTFVNNGIEVRHITEATHAPIRPVAARELRASTERSWRTGPVGQPNRRPGTTTENPARPGSAYNNGNNLTPRGGTQEQNNFSRPMNNQNQQPGRNLSGPMQNQNAGTTQNRYGQPANAQNPQANRNWPANPQTPAQNFNDDKRITSPRGQTLDQQTPRSTPPITPNRVYSAPAGQPPAGSPPVNNPNERTSSPRPEYSAPAAHVSPPPPPAPAPSRQPSASQSSGKPDQNGNGQGH